MWKFTLPALLTVLLILMACSGTTSTPEGTAVAVPTAVQEQSPTVARTATPAEETAPDPTGFPRTAPTTTPGPTGAEAATPPAIPKAPEATGESPAGIITPLMLDDPQTVASEISDSELACLGGTSDIGRLSRIFSGIDESTPQELTQILGCLQDEIILRMFLGGVIRDPAPLSLETGACIRDALEGIDLRSAMLAATLRNGQNDMIVAGIFVTIACLNDEEWETAATVADVDPDTKEALLCRLEEIGWGPKA